MSVFLEDYCRGTQTEMSRLLKKSLPQGCENWRMYADEGHLVFVGTWEYNSGNNHLDKEHV